MISAGFYLNKVNESSTGALFENSFPQFGDNGGILLVEYDKLISSSETGFNITALQQFTLNTNNRLPDKNKDIFNSKKWYVCETQANGTITEWYRSYTKSINSAYPIPFSSFVSKVYIQLTWIGDTSNITSKVKLYLLNNDK
jgi:hypothetical protein